MKYFTLIAVFILFSCSKEDDLSNDSGTGISIANNKRPTGSSANDLLSDKTFIELYT